MNKNKKSLYIVSTNSNLEFKNAVNNLIILQMSENLFLDRMSAAYILRNCYENSQNLTVKNIIDNQDFENMSKSDKFTVIGDFYLKQMLSGHIVLDKDYNLYPIFCGKTPKDIAERFLEFYDNDQNKNYYYNTKTRFLELNKKKWANEISNNTIHSIIPNNIYSDISNLLKL